jgi:O-antigen ligase
MPDRDLVSRALGALLLAAVFVLPLVFIPSLADGFALPKVLVLRVAGLLGVCLFLVRAWSTGGLTRGGDRRIDLPLACFAGLLVMSSLVSVDAVQSFSGEPYQYQGLVTVLLYLGSFFVARLTLGSMDGFRRVLTVTVAAGAVVAVYGIAQALGFDPFWSGSPDKRIISSLGQANDVAAYLDMVVVAAIGIRAEASRARRIVLDAVIVLALCALALTFSRGGFLGLVVALSVLVIASPRFPSRRWFVALGVVFAAGILVVFLAIPPGRALVERVADRIVTITELGEGSIHMHLDQWRLGVQVAIDNPLFGTGPETFPLVFRPYLDDVLPPDRARILGAFRLESPHNEFIGIAAEMGLPALLAYVAFVVMCAAICILRARSSTGSPRMIAVVVLATLAAHVVTNLFMTPAVTTSEVFWVTIGAGLAALGSGAPHAKASASPGDDRTAGSQTPAEQGSADINTLLGGTTSHREGSS